MCIKKIIPISVKDHYKLLKIQKKYGDSINSHQIHSNCSLGKKVYIATGVDLRANVKIGDYSYVNKNTLIASGNIGKYCSIGYNCQIGVFEHPTNLISTSPHIYRHRNLSESVRPSWSLDDINLPPQIGSDVWIGSNVIVMQGVNVGDGAILAAGAIITKDVEPYAIVGGVPAKLIRKRFSEQHIKELLEFEWWNKSDEWINSNIDKFMDINDFIKTIKKFNV